MNESLEENEPLRLFLSLLKLVERRGVWSDWRESTLSWCSVDWLYSWVLAGLSLDRPRAEGERACELEGDLEIFVEIVETDSDEEADRLLFEPVFASGSSLRRSRFRPRSCSSLANWSSATPFLEISCKYIAWVTCTYESVGTKHCFWSSLIYSYPTTWIKTLMMLHFNCRYTNFRKLLNKNYNSI
jgi:hypothetical protein